MSMERFECIRFSQYGQEESDNLIMFAAPAKKIYNWAGIPRKAWQIRMLFQRPITKVRGRELKDFWKVASSPNEGLLEKRILGPTAIVIAIQGSPTVNDNQIDISYTPVVDVTCEPIKNISILAKRVYPSVFNRLDKEQKILLEEFRINPFQNFPDIEHDYVFEFALQLTQMISDSERFVQVNAIEPEAQREIVLSMESICRPAIVVDGQHRLWGAAHIQKNIVLPVVAIPNCDWIEQIYQFVVINEKSQKVETSLLTDIFGSSLTKSEQVKVRGTLERSKVDVESRIAAVIASRTEDSPFYNMVKLKIEGTAPEEYSPYLTERTIRALIDGTSQNYSRGWRSDDDFYEEFIKPKFPDRSEWESWTNGLWRDYWFCFWSTIRDYYNDQSLKSPLAVKVWDPINQTNLTKAVTLRQVQTLFMEKCIERMKTIDQISDILKRTLGDDLAEENIQRQKQELSIPISLQEFQVFVTEFFLEKGIPLRVFTTKWKKSLDDAQGQMDLWDTLVTAFERTNRNERFVCRGRIFEATDE